MKSIFILFGITLVLFLIISIPIYIYTMRAAKKVADKRKEILKNQAEKKRMIKLIKQYRLEYSDKSSEKLCAILDSLPSIDGIAKGSDEWIRHDVLSDSIAAAQEKEILEASVKAHKKKVEEKIAKDKKEAEEIIAKARQEAEDAAKRDKEARAYRLEEVKKDLKESRKRFVADDVFSRDEKFPSAEAFVDCFMGDGLGSENRKKGNYGAGYRSVHETGYGFGQGKGAKDFSYGSFATAYPTHDFFSTITRSVDRVMSSVDDVLKEGESQIDKAMKQVDASMKQVDAELRRAQKIRQTHLDDIASILQYSSDSSDEFIEEDDEDDHSSSSSASSESSEST